MWALVMLLVVFPSVNEGHRIVPRSRQSLENFDVPSGARIIVNGKAACDQKALKKYSWHSLIGRSVASGRKCMGVDADEPIFVGTGCWGKDCFMELVPGPASCMLKGLGVDVDPNNSTRQETCGIAPEHSYWLEPSKDDNGSREDDTLCAISSSLDAKLELWAPCINGEPIMITKLSFSKDPGDFYYTCKANPGGTRVSLHARVVCYTV